MSASARLPFVTAYARLGGIVWIPRMLQKIRQQAAGQLPPDYEPWLGKGFDGRCCRFLKISYPALAERVRAGATDDEALAWIRAQGPGPSEEEIGVWNDFMSKRGWRDSDAPPEKFQEYKAKYGQGHRADILTFFDFYDVDEGRKP